MCRCVKESLQRLEAPAPKLPQSKKSESFTSDFTSLPWKVTVAYSSSSQHPTMPYHACIYIYIWYPPRNAWVIGIGCVPQMQQNIYNQTSPKYSFI